MKSLPLSAAILALASLTVVARLVPAGRPAYGGSGTDPVLHAEDLRKQGRLVEAEAVLETALNAAERSGRQDVRLALIINNLANVSGILRKYERSERLYKRCIRLWDDLGMADTPHRARTVGGLMIMYVNASEFRKAEAVYSGEIKRLRATVELPDEERARLLQQAGIIAHVGSKWGEAERRYEQALALFEKSGHRASSDLASVLNLLAVVHFRTGRYSSSLELLARARSTVEQNVHPASPQLVHILVNHGSFVRDDTTAEESFREALTIAVSSFGDEHPDTALVLEAYAKRLRSTGRKSEAKSLERRAKAIMESNSETIRTRHTVDLSELVRQRAFDSRAQDLGFPVNRRSEAR